MIAVAVTNATLPMVDLFSAAGTDFLAELQQFQPVAVGVLDVAGDAAGGKLGGWVHGPGSALDEPLLDGLDVVDQDRDVGSADGVALGGGALGRRRVQVLDQLQDVAAAEVEIRDYQVGVLVADDGVDAGADALVLCYEFRPTTSR